MFDIRLLDAPFDPHSAADLLASATPDAGGITTFVGKVRAGNTAGETGANADTNADATVVEALELSHYEPLTLPGMRDLAETARARFDLLGLVILHRTGRLEPGDPIVCVSAASRHRRDGIAAVDFCMDHLKGAAWFWKRELRGGSWHWIEPRAVDHDDLARWNGKNSSI